MANKELIQISVEELDDYKKCKEAYEKLKSSVKNYRESAPHVECECGFVTKSYMMKSHMKSARHRRILEIRKHMHAAKEALDESDADSRANSSNSQGGNTGESKI